MFSVIPAASWHQLGGAHCRAAGPYPLTSADALNPPYCLQNLAYIQVSENALGITDIACRTHQKVNLTGLQRHATQLLNNVH